MWMFPKKRGPLHAPKENTPSHGLPKIDRTLWNPKLKVQCTIQKPGPPSPKPEILSTEKRERYRQA